MIHAKDLRVGNLVQSISTRGYERPGIVKVISIGEQEINSFRDMGASGGHYYSTLSGIPLTPKWLNKCGIVIGAGEATGFYAGINGLAIQQAGNDWWVCLRGTQGYQLIRSVNFVHELQNCAFILTGQDLKIEL